MKVYIVGARLTLEVKRLFRKPTSCVIERWNRWVYFYANNEQEAIERSDLLIDEYYYDGWMEYKVIAGELIAKEITTATFETLKNKLPSCDFIQYCKDNFMPVNVVIGGDK